MTQPLKRAVLRLPNTGIIFLFNLDFQSAWVLLLKRRTLHFVFSTSGVAYHFYIHIYIFQMNALPVIAQLKHLI